MRLGCVAPSTPHRRRACLSCAFRLWQLRGCRGVSCKAYVCTPCRAWPCVAPCTTVEPPTANRLAASGADAAGPLTASRGPRGGVRVGGGIVPDFAQSQCRCGEGCLGEEHLARAEKVADGLHPVHQRPLNHMQRPRHRLAALLHVLVDELDDACSAPPGGCDDGVHLPCAKGKPGAMCSDPCGTERAGSHPVATRASVAQRCAGFRTNGPPTAARGVGATFRRPLRLLTNAAARPHPMW